MVSTSHTNIHKPIIHLNVLGVKRDIKATKYNEKLCLLDHHDSRRIKQLTIPQAIIEASLIQGRRDGMTISEMKHFMTHSFDIRRGAQHSEGVEKSQKIYRADWRTAQI